MASTPSRSSARLRDKDKAVRGAVGGRDNAESLARSSRTPRRSNRLQPEPPPIVVNFHGDVQIKGTMFGHSASEELGQLRGSRSTLPAAANAYGETAPRIPKSRRVIALEHEEEDEDEEEFEYDREDSCDDEPSQPPLVSRAASTSAQRVQTLQEDSGYSGSTRVSKREKNEAYRASLSKRSLDRSLAAKPPSIELNVEEVAASEDNETHLATQRDDGGDNGEDSDDDFECRLMKVATVDHSEVDVNVILDTGTKPDWISSRFLTEKLGLKITRFSDEENKQEFRDFNGNKFNAIGKAEVMVRSTDFIGFPCRMISFLVARGGTFQILLGSRTIKKDKLFCKPLDAAREGAFPAVLTGPKKAEKAVIVQNKEKQKRTGAERDKMREENRKANTKERKESKSSSSSAARLAQELKPQQTTEKSTSPSPLSNAKHPGSNTSKLSWKKSKAPVHERSSSSSLSSGGAAIDG